MEMKTKEVCSEKDGQDSEAGSYATASRRVCNKHDKPASAESISLPRVSWMARSKSKRVV